VNILDPEVVVIGGGLIAAGDLLLGPVRRAFTGHVEGGADRVPVDIVAAELGDDAGMLGAAWLARSVAS
jgi:glucokinase